MFYNDEYQNKLEEELVEIYNSLYKKTRCIVTKTTIEKIYTISKNKNYASKFKHPLVEYVINNNEIVYNNTLAKIYKDTKDNRYDDYYNMLMNTCKWCIKEKMFIPNTSLFIWIDDRPPWEFDLIKDLPIWFPARSRSHKFLLIPENSFECINLDKKYTGKCYNWDTTKEKILHNVNKIDKDNTMYFKGCDTTNFNHNVRKNLEDYSKISQFPMKIKLDAWVNFEPLWNFANYKMLLDLPGRYPWSNRTKYLFLMDSVVIRIDVESIGDDYKDKPWISFIDYIVNTDDYVGITIKYYRNKNVTDKEKNEKEFKKLIKKLEIVYTHINNNPNKYKKMVKNAKTKVSKLTNDRIYQYIYTGIVLNSKIKFIN
jgi:hypothetical protein